jgi:hypothetical protein
MDVALRAGDLRFVPRWLAHVAWQRLPISWAASAKTSSSSYSSSSCLSLNTVIFLQANSFSTKLKQLSSL